MMSIEGENSDQIAPEQFGDSRGIVTYLVAYESSQYIAIMEVLEASITDLTPSEVRPRLHAEGHKLEQVIVEARLDKLREWGAASARTDTSRIIRHSDLLARNWRYTATPAGRQVQRFYRKVLANAPTLREIPLPSLARVVAAAEALASSATDDTAPELIGTLFVNHDDLDAALVGAEDSLTGLVDRFDLNNASTAELQALLVGYATHVAAELEHGSARAYRALKSLRPRFEELATLTIRTSDARALIERGALGASHGGRSQDWDALLAWFDPGSGRAARFALRLVRALPGMHMNLRRLHSSSGAATNRSRALALAKACLDRSHGTAILLAALADHPWRKLYGDAGEAEGQKIRSWRDGPHVAVRELLRATGRAGPRGRAAPGRDDTQAREHVRAARERRAAEHAAAINEILAAKIGTCISEQAARVALTSLLAATRATSTNGRRTAVRDGLRCTLFYDSRSVGTVAAPTWRIRARACLPSARYVSGNADICCVNRRARLAEYSAGNDRMSDLPSNTSDNDAEAFGGSGIQKRQKRWLPEASVEAAAVLRRLAARPWLIAGRDDADIAAVRRNVESIRQTLGRLGWVLIVERDFIRLRKSPPARRDAWSVEGPIPLQASWFFLLVAAAESVAPRVTLAQLVTAGRTAAAEAGVSLAYDISVRRAIVYALKMLDDRGVVMQMDGDVEGFVEDENAPVLLAVHHARLLHVIAHFAPVDPNLNTTTLAGAGRARAGSCAANAPEAG